MYLFAVLPCITKLLNIGLLCNEKALFIINFERLYKKLRLNLVPTII